MSARRCDMAMPLRYRWRCSSSVLTTPSWLVSISGNSCRCAEEAWEAAVWQEVLGVRWDERQTFQSRIAMLFMNL